MKLIFGLGNPGDKYLCTRHNIGARLVDVIAKKINISLKKKVSCLCFCGQGRFKSSSFILATPLVFMNQSGEALRLLVKKFNLPFENLLVIYDDIDLSFGTIRFRTRGGPGTHRGMASCIELLGSSDFQRLRIGIRGERGGRDLSEYVLENFAEDEEIGLKEVLDKAMEKAITFLQS